jgi:2-polyprenyl-3-methyl-5-hydroxy-6-metoxy-1,4-benzoquinol methylase
MSDGAAGSKVIQEVPLCRICGCEVEHYLTDLAGHKLKQCKKCGFVQVSQKPSQEDLKLIYQESYFGHDKYRDGSTQRVENLRRLEMLKSHVDPGSRVLEVGCGDGSFLQLAKNNYKIYGFDLSPVGIEIARKKNADIIERIWVGSLESQASSGGCFDAICMWDVIEHLWNPYPECAKLINYLKPGGVLLISTPNIGAPLAKLMGKRWAFMTPPEHLGFFNKNSLKYLFENCLSAQIVDWRSMGKRVNLGFILYKARRVMPSIPEFITKIFERFSTLSKLAVYLPTGDIQYVIIRKRESE